MTRRVADSIPTFLVGIVLAVVGVWLLIVSWPPAYVDGPYGERPYEGYDACESNHAQRCLGDIPIPREIR